MENSATDGQLQQITNDSLNNFYAAAHAAGMTHNLPPSYQLPESSKQWVSCFTHSIDPKATTTTNTASASTCQTTNTNNLSGRVYTTTGKTIDEINNANNAATYQHLNSAENRLNCNIPFSWGNYYTADENTTAIRDGNTGQFLKMYSADDTSSYVSADGFFPQPYITPVNPACPTPYMPLNAFHPSNNFLSPDTTHQQQPGHQQLGAYLSAQQHQPWTASSVEGSHCVHSGTPALGLTPRLVLHASGAKFLGSDSQTNNTSGFKSFVDGGDTLSRNAAAVESASEWHDRVFKPLKKSWWNCSAFNNC